MATSKKPANPDAVASASAALMETLKPVLLNLEAPEKKMASRSNWNGILTFGALTMSVKTFKATEVETVDLNQVHHCNHDAADEAPIFNQLKRGDMRCPVCDVAVASSDIIKGYKYGENDFAIVSDEEKKSCMVASNKKMEIIEFVKFSEVDPIYFESSEYIAPDKGFEKPFALLRQGMIDRSVVAIAQSNQRGREQTVILRSFGENGMTLHYMFFENEIRGFDKWTTVAVNANEAKMAGLLIDELTDEFDPAQYSDTFTRSYKELINAKISGTAAPVIKHEAEPTADAKVDIMAVLVASMTAPNVIAKKAKKAAKAAPQKTSAAVA